MEKSKRVTKSRSPWKTKLTRKQEGITTQWQGTKNWLGSKYSKYSTHREMMGIGRSCRKHTGSNNQGQHVSTHAQSSRLIIYNVAFCIALFSERVNHVPSTEKLIHINNIFISQKWWSQCPIKPMSLYNLGSLALWTWMCIQTNHRIYEQL